VSILKGALLGILQGVTEFLPVSSSGHLVLAQNLLGFKGEKLVFDVAVHFGTLLAIVFAFRRDVIELFRIGKPSNRRMLLLLIAANLPTAVIGGLMLRFLENFIENIPTIYVGAALVLTGLLLFIADRWKSKKEEVGLWEALIMGFAQGVALVPGISRSGATIASGMISGVRGDVAARFSFLMAIPAILGATAMELPKLSFGIANGAFGWQILVGTMAAAITGFVMIKVLLAVIKARRLSVFAYYCWMVGIIAVGAGIAGR